MLVVVVVAMVMVANTHSLSPPHITYPPPAHSQTIPLITIPLVGVPVKPTELARTIACSLRCLRSSSVRGAVLAVFVLWHIVTTNQDTERIFVTRQGLIASANAGDTPKGPGCPLSAQRRL